MSKDKTLLQSPSQPVVAEPFDDCLGVHVEANAKRFAQASPPPVQGEVTRHQVRMGARYLMQASAAGRLSEDEIVRVIMDRLAHSQTDTQEGEAIAALVREKEQPL